jgi:glycosyltransferase involved in cell wall biosynthesis
VLDNDDLARRADITENDDDIRKTLGLAPGERFFFLPSRFVAKKNIPRVVTAYREARDQEMNFPQLVIAGRGPDREKVVLQIEEAGLSQAITLIDWLDYESIPRIAKLSEAVLLASTDDQWGLIINEALAAGSPVLVSNRAGAHELVKNNLNGFTFDPLDIQHLSALLKQLAQDPALVDRLRKGARSSMESFSKDDFVAAWFEIFERYGLLEQRHSSR